MIDLVQQYLFSPMHDLSTGNNRFKMEEGWVVDPFKWRVDDDIPRQVPSPVRTLHDMGLGHQVVGREECCHRLIRHFTKKIIVEKCKANALSQLVDVLRW
uniref:Uncharacterized protein n=1 Tax=Amphora coffeiformis TaxID=265554 RepID=A0A6S8JSQ0_9STRA|mmetsp:Transcript_5234/g.10058  ORF Transcript_5234/g.10058 Transcript_5234/m.10058 type:complete len:100 (+) Transcript_5234:813-1112(+)